MNQIEKLVNGWLIEVVLRLKFYHTSKITLAFDLYEQPFYGDPSYDWMLGTQYKKGTSYAITYLVASIATQNIRCPVAVRLMTNRLVKTKLAVVSQVLDDLFIWLPINTCII